MTRALSASSDRPKAEVIRVTVTLDISSPQIMEGDSDLARALALSLQEAKTMQHYRDSEDAQAQFEADVQHAIEESKSANATNPVHATAQQSTFLSERAQLELERLKRQKRLRGDDMKEDEPRSKRQQISSSNRVRSMADNFISNSPTPPAAGRSYDADASSELFWDGEIRQTGNKYVDSRKDTKPTFNLTDIIGDTSTISFAIISSYTTDWEFAFSRFAVGHEMSIPVVIVSHPAGDRTPGIKAYQEQNWIKTQPLLHTMYSSMHMKFMLIFYKTGRLRVMITTANLIGYDWMSIENTAWVQDVPLRDKPVARDRKANDFPAMFQSVLKAVNVKPALDCFLRDHPNLPLQSLDDLRCKWDFSRVKVHLIASLSGKHEQWSNVIQTGHPRLMKVVRDIGARAGPSKELHLECQGSSVGKCSRKWLKEFYHSARGGDAQHWLKKKGRAKTEHLPWPGNRIKILFPTKGTVQNSTLGEPGGGTMFFRRSDWNSANYPRELFHDSKSKRGKILMHSKMIIGTLKQMSSNNGLRFDGDVDDDSDIEILGERKPTGWAYVGSHNFTMAAWGSFMEKSTQFTPIYSVANYELGIVIPLYSEKEADDIACWVRPPTSYAAHTSEPWIQSESVHFQAE